MSILITGGSGSFGRAFARHLLDRGSGRVCILSRGEHAQAAMRDESPDEPREAGRSIYVASSWRNKFQPTIVERLRADGFDVYDFRNPGPGGTGLDFQEGEHRCTCPLPTQVLEQLAHGKGR